MTQWVIACVVELSIASGATGPLLLLAPRDLDRQLAPPPACSSIALALVCAAGLRALLRKLAALALVEGGAGDLAGGGTQGRVGGCWVGTSWVCAAGSPTLLPHPAGDPAASACSQACSHASVCVRPI